ncbi:MAG TPA: NAD(P)/FAD-dependent oxidoreductase [Pseudonocardiaceae bacterium]|jgi:3-(3-hydroxy-phenyl)propionate hydroxylase|nr:NAD(P)/FAD-dependent oxidoreductase [Pseudonocardiaceae bacterium]
MGTAHPQTLPAESVVVVGFGPVGAVAALALARRGIPVTVLEANPAVRTDAADSRASTFHPPTLEMLAELGVFPQLFETGLVAPTYQLRDRTKGLIAHFDLALLEKDTRFPFRLQSEQQNLVQIVRREIEHLPQVDLRFGAPVLAAAQDGSDIVLTVGGDRPSTLRVRHVIAADGASSPVRQSLGIDFPGLTYQERFLVASTTEPFEELLPGIASVNYISDAREWLVLLRTPRHWRALFPVDGEADEAELTDPVAVQRRLQGVAPLDRDYTISHVTLYRVHQRVAGTFVRGGLLLAGDAAHINNPLGGMGMNSGIHDALAAVEAILSERAGDTGAIGRYDELRRTKAIEFVQKATHRNWEQLQERDPDVRERRNETMTALAADPAKAREYLLVSSMLADRIGTAV